MCRLEYRGSIQPGCHFWTLLWEYDLRSTRSRRINWFCCKLWSKTIGLNKIANQQKTIFGTPYSTWAVWVFALSFAEQLSFLLLCLRLFLKASLSFISIFIVRQLNKLSDRRFKCCLNYQKATWLLFCQSTLLECWG